MLEQEVRVLIQAWVSAEARGDTTFLSRALAPDFLGIGPRGFLLTKEEWLQRYTSGDLVNKTFELSEVRLRHYAPVVIAVGQLMQNTVYQGHDVPGEFRVTLVWVKHEEWVLAHLQLSSII